MRRWAMIAMLLLTAAATHARAEELQPGLGGLNDTQRAEYEDLTKKGIREYELGHWEEAKSYFFRAHALLPNARTLRALGLIAFESRSYIEAIDWLERALADQRKPLTGQMRDDVVDLLKDARGFVGHVTVALEPSSASVFVDGALTQLRDRNVVLLDPGEHELRVEAVGYHSQRRTLRVEGGKSIELKLALDAVESRSTAPLRVDVAAAPPASEAPPESWWTTQRIVGASLGAAAVAAFGVGITAGLLAMSAKSDSDRNCTGDECNAAGASARDTAVARADIATAGFIAGGALLTAGAITFFVAPEPERARVRLRPGPGLAGLAIAGSL